MLSGKMNGVHTTPIRDRHKLKEFHKKNFAFIKYLAHTYTFKYTINILIFNIHIRIYLHIQIYMYVCGT